MVWPLWSLASAADLIQLQGLSLGTETPENPNRREVRIGHFGFVLKHVKFLGKRQWPAPLSPASKRAARALRT